MYQSVNDELRSKLKNNSKSIAGGRIGYGHNEAYEKSAFVGVIMGLVIGIYLIAPEFQDGLGITIRSSDEYFWPIFISMIVLTVLMSKGLETLFKNRGMNKFLDSPELTVDMGTILLQSIKNRPAFAVLESDYKTPYPHYLNIMYMNAKKPRILPPGTRVYILKTSNSIAIIPVTDITGASEASAYTYDSGSYDIEDMECIYHPGVYYINSTERPLTQETKTLECRRMSSRTMAARLKKAIAIGLWTFGILVFCWLFFQKYFSIPFMIWLVFSFGAANIAIGLGFVIYTLKMQRKIYNSDYVKTAFVEFPRTMAWTGSAVISTAENIDGTLGRYSYEIKDASRRYLYFETAEIFYKKEIDGVQTLC